MEQQINKTLDLKMESNTILSFYLKKVNIKNDITTMINPLVKLIDKRITLINNHFDNFLLKEINFENIFYESSADNDKKNRIKFNFKLAQNLNITKFFNDIDLLISFDGNINRLYGSFIFKNKNKDNCDDYDFLEQIYLNNLIKKFINDNLSSLSYYNLTSKLMNSKKDFLGKLKKEWLDIFTTNFKVSKSSPEELSKILNELMIIFTGCQSIIFNIGTFLQVIDETNLNYINPFDTNKTKIKINSLVNFAKILNEEIKCNVKNYKNEKKRYGNNKFNLGVDDLNFSSPTNSYIIENSDNFKLVNEQFYEKNPYLFLLLVLLIFPEFFDLSEKSLLFMDFEELKNSFEMYKEVKNVNRKYLIKKIKNKMIESNFDYLSFLNQDSTMVSICSINAKERIYFDNYLWVQSFTNSIIKQKHNVEDQVAYVRKSYIRKKRYFFRQAIKDIHDISFQNIQNIFTTNWTSNIVEKFYNELNLKQDLEKLIAELKYDDEALKRQSQRELIIFGFFVATLIAFVDFGNMTWTVLSCSVTGLGLPLAGGGDSAIPAPIVDSNIALLVLLMVVNSIILIATVIFIVHTHKKYHKINNRIRMKL